MITCVSKFNQVYTTLASCRASNNNNGQWLPQPCHRALQAPPVEPPCLLCICSTCQLSTLHCHVPSRMRPASSPVAPVLCAPHPLECLDPLYEMMFCHVQSLHVHMWTAPLVRVALSRSEDSRSSLASSTRLAGGLQYSMRSGSARLADGLPDICASFGWLGGPQWGPVGSCPTCALPVLTCALDWHSKAPRGPPKTVPALWLAAPQRELVGSCCPLHPGDAHTEQAAVVW